MKQNNIEQKSKLSNYQFNYCHQSSYQLLKLLNQQ